jgi:hypothetical protein
MPVLCSARLRGDEFTQALKGRRNLPVPRNRWVPRSRSRFVLLAERRGPRLRATRQITVHQATSAPVSEDLDRILENI